MGSGSSPGSVPAARKDVGVVTVTLTSGLTENAVIPSGSVKGSVEVGAEVGVAGRVEVAVARRVVVVVGSGSNAVSVSVGTLPLPTVMGGGAEPSQISPKGQHPPESQTLLGGRRLVRGRLWTVSRVGITLRDRSYRLVRSRTR